MPGWAADTIWWQVFPLGFVGAEPEALPDTAPPRHRLPALEPWLDYAIELGANGLSLGPVFSSQTHGYDTTDHFRIDPRLGDDADFDALAGAARSRGMRVMLDGVFNHVGWGHPAFQRVLAEGPGSPAAGWFRLRWPEDASPGARPDYDVFEGHGSLVALDHRSPDVADLVTAVMTHWCDRGADAWRLDAAYAVPPGFWAPVLARLRSRHPDVYVVGEVIHGDYPAIVAESTMDSVTQYELWKAVWSGFNDRNLFELAWALGRHDEFLDSFLPLTFVGNHDVTRIASRLEDPRLLAHALVVLFTVGGTPSVYAGDEQGFRGVKHDRVGGDDEVRPPFPAHPAQLSDLGAPIHRLHQELIGLRRRHRWLPSARSRVLALTNEALCYESVHGDDRLVVALNLSDQPVTLEAPGAGPVLAGSAVVRATGDAVTLTARGWAVIGDSARGEGG